MKLTFSSKPLAALSLSLLFVGSAGLSFGQNKPAIPAKPAPSADKSAAKGGPPAAPVKPGPTDKTPAKPGAAPAAPGQPVANAKPADAIPAPFVKPNRPLASITALAYSADGKKIAVGSYGEVVVYDTTTWQQTGLFRQVEDSVRTLAFNPDNQTLAVGSGLPGRSGQTVIWDTTGAQKPHAFPNQYDAIESVAFEKTGKSLLIGADDNKVRYVADTGGGNGTVLDSHNGRVQAVAFSPTPDSIFVTGAMDKIVKVWDLKSVKNVINFDQSEAGITGLAFLNNGVQFVGSSLDGRLYWWGVNYDQKKNTYNGYHFRTIGAHNGGVYTMSRSANGNRIITGGPDHAACIWDINNGNQVRAFRDTTTQPIYAAALSPDGKIAAAGGREGLVYIWDVEANKQITTLVPPALPAAVTASPHATAKSTGNSSPQKKASKRHK